MDDFLTANQETMKRAIKEINQYDQDLKGLSNWWEKIALIGKINSFEVASTILQDMDDTLSQFNTLQERLIKNLIDEHTRKIIVQNSSRCQMAIDVLIRNLFERTADIGFLSTDHDVINFLKSNDINESNKEYLEDRLRSYINIYSVYQDALLLTPDGKLVFQLSQLSRIENIQDPIINQAIENPNDYVEFFGETQLMGNSNKHLLYANAVVEDDIVVGVIVLCFRFNNELEGIIERLLLDGEANHFSLLNGAGEMLFAPQYARLESLPTLTLDSTPQIISFANKNMIKICEKGQPYQDYKGPKDWHMCSLLPLSAIENKTTQKTSDNTNLLSEVSGLIPTELFDVQHQSKTINDDLQLIVLNGIIAAARKNAVEFMPVLEAIKTIGFDINNTFDNSIESLFSAIISGQLDGIRLQANLAVDIMDRNLFERANDCRWWGLSSLLRNALSKKEVDYDCIRQTLLKIHTLYTVYHTLYIYDKNGRYIAFSDDQYNGKVGSPVEENSGISILFQLENKYQYTVSKFEPFKCYQGESTYIYNAALRDMKNDENIIGGIGIVFDSTAEFNAILTDILPQKNGVTVTGAKALFTTDTGLILASTSSEHIIGKQFLPNIDMLELEEKGTVATIVKLDGCIYLLAAAKSTGYREYKRDDGYKNPVISWVLTPC